MSQAHVLETICVKFHQNRPSRLGCRADTDRQTYVHIHTDRHPGPIQTYSVKMTECKNEGTVMATVLVRFSQNLVCRHLIELLGLGLKFSILRHQLPVENDG